MKKTTISIIIGAMFVIAPMTANAATLQELQAQIQQLLSLVASLQQQLVQNTNTTQQPTSTYAPTTQCINIQHNLWLGKRDGQAGDDVSKLQRFLQSTGDFTYGSITGYYGPATLRAVQRWQSGNGVVSHGSPNTTGYGVVGPATRAKMRIGCTSTPTITYTPPTINISPQNTYLNVNERCTGFTFINNLQLGSSETEGEEIFEIKKFLNMPVKDGTEHIFDQDTKSYVEAFQRKYTSEILSPNGLMLPNGLWNATTRAKANQINSACAQSVEDDDLRAQIQSLKALIEALKRDIRNKGVEPIMPHTIPTSGPLHTQHQQLMEIISALQRQLENVSTQTVQVVKPPLTTFPDDVSVDIIGPVGEEQFKLDDNLTVLWRVTGPVPLGTYACVSLSGWPSWKHNGTSLRFPPNSPGCTPINNAQTYSVSGVLTRTPGFSLTPSEYTATVRLTVPVGAYNNHMSDKTLDSDTTSHFSILEE